MKLATAICSLGLFFGSAFVEPQLATPQDACKAPCTIIDCRKGPNDTCWILCRDAAGKVSGCIVPRSKAKNCCKIKCCK